MSYMRCALAGLVMWAGLAGLSQQASAQESDELDEVQDLYVDGNLLFLTYHELGHVILHQVLNVDQRQNRLASEEYADDIATWLMLPDPDEPEQDEEILAALIGWIDSADQQEGPSESPHYPDDIERAARIACYLYGSDPDLYAELGEVFSEAFEDVDCMSEVDALHDDFESWFGDFLVEPGEQDSTRVTVQYGPAGPGQEEARDVLIESGILDFAAEDVSQFIRLPRDVYIVAQSCGPGAAEFRYNPNARRISACYEAVAWFLGHADEEAVALAPRSEGGSSPGASDDDDLGSGGARVRRKPRPRPR